MLSFSKTSALRRNTDLRKRALTIILAAVFVCAAAFQAFAQNTKVDGEWLVELVLPLGEQTFTMLIDQKDGVLSGHMVNEFGQFDLSGSINRDQVKLQWSFPDGGKLQNVTFNGKVSGSTMSGTAKIANLGEGPMEVRRK
jgi:hypothetical protein